MRAEAVLSLHRILACSTVLPQTWSASLRIYVKETVTLLVNSKTYEKVVLHMTFEGAKSQGRSPVKPARMVLEIGHCCINQQSQP